MKFSHVLLTTVFVIVIGSIPVQSWGLASNNIPLDSPIYLYLEKLAGFGLIESDVKGLKPYAKAEAARLVLEAEENMPKIDAALAPFASEVINRVRELIPREVSLIRAPEKAPLFNCNPVSSARSRYVYLDGIPRDYNRFVRDPGYQKVFGFIGTDHLRRSFQPIVHQSGTEGTPLSENNEGVVYQKGGNFDLRLAMEGFISNKFSALIEPHYLHSQEHDIVDLQKGYFKLGSGGLELEVGRDANWFGPGYRGSTVLTNNAKNFDLIKLSSPEPLDVGWVKKYLGDFKYAVMASRFDETGTGEDLRHPYFIALKLALKPKPWIEMGFNLVRQEGGPGFTGNPSFIESIFGGGDNDHINALAGFDLRFRIPWLWNAEIYGEYSGEDSAGVWPFVESYVAGVYLPRVFPSGRDDFRFEYFFGNRILYTDHQFPTGYMYHNMPPGHSQGGATQDYFFRYSHWFSPRMNAALEYFHTSRGQEGRVTVDSAGELDPNGTLQAIERKNSLRAFWKMPVFGDTDVEFMYGWERVNNFNLVGDVNQTNQIIRVDISYRY